MDPCEAQRERLDSGPRRRRRVVDVCLFRCHHSDADPRAVPVLTSSTSAAQRTPHNWIVYQPAREEGLRIARTDLGGGYYQVNGPAGVSTNPDWARTDGFAQPPYSPKGDRLVAELVHRPWGTEASPVTGSSLVVVDLATGKVGRALTDPALFAEHSDWGDSGLIVFDRRLKPDSEATDVFTIRPDGSGLTRLTRFADKGGSGGQPSMTPDGRVLLCVQATATAEYALMTVNLTGRHLSQAVTGRSVAGVHARMAAVS